MKKAYVKPGMYVENFSLSQSIAAGCGAHHNSSLGTPMQGDKSTCGWLIGRDIIWVAAPACNELCPEELPMDGVCYNNPNGGQSIFNS